MANRKFTDEERARAKELRESGMGWNSIAREIGAGTNTVRMWLDPDFKARAEEQQREYRKKVRQPRRREEAARTRHHRVRPCPDCGRDFEPKSGNQIRCSACALERKRESARRTAAGKRRTSGSSPVRITPSQTKRPKPSRGASLRGSVLGMHIERRVAERVRRMKDEE